MKTVKVSTLKSSKKKPANVARSLMLSACFFTLLVPVILTLFVQQMTVSTIEREVYNLLKDYIFSQTEQKIKQVLEGIHKNVSSISEIVSLTDKINSEQERALLETYFTSADSNLKEVIISPLSTVKKLSRNKKSISFAQLDLLRSLEKGDQVLPELVTLNGEHNIFFGSPIKNATGEIIGTVLVTYRTQVFEKQLLQMSQELGYLHIAQVINGREVDWMISGLSNQVEHVSKNINLFGMTWRITLGLTEEPYKDHKGMTSKIIYGGVAGVFLAVLMLLIVGSLLNTLQKNLQKLAIAFKESNRPAVSLHDYSLAGFDAAHRSLEKTFESLSNKARVSNESKSPNFTENKKEIDSQQQAIGLQSPSERESSSLFQDQDLLDVDLDLEDEELFETSSSNQQGNEVMLEPTIFRQYDIRGVVEEALTIEVVQWLGQAIGTYAQTKGENKVVVGRDGRLSSEALGQALQRGLMASGCDVIDIGQVSTPLVYFGTYTLGTASGVMVTGSHNPPNYNGLKIVIAGETLYGTQIIALKQIIERNQYKAGQGQIEQVDIETSYLERVTQDIVLARPMKVVVDAGNGVVGPTLLSLLRQLGCEVTPLFCEVDGQFPNHHPDPSKPENLTTLIETVIAEEADVGLAFDGDGDRLGVVTRSGKIIFPDRLLMLYAKDILSRNPGGDVIFDVKCTSDLNAIVTSQGGRPIMWKTGHSLIKAKLKETGALIAGEMSGHIFFNDRWYGFDDALYSAARLLELLSMETRSVDDVFDSLPEKFSTPEIGIAVSEDSKFKIIEELQYSGEFEGKVITIDGIRVDYDYGWGLVRASNTTPTLVARFEADTEQQLDKIQEEFRRNLLKVDSALLLPF